MSKQKGLVRYVCTCMHGRSAIKKENITKVMLRSTLIDKVRLNGGMLDE